MPSQKATFDTVAGRSGAMVQHFYCRLGQFLPYQPKYLFDYKTQDTDRILFFV